MNYEHFLISNKQHSGVAEGYMVTAHADNWKEFLYDTFPDDAQNIISIIDKHGYSTIAVLKHLYVDEDKRGCGIGRILFEQFKEQSSYAQMVLLCADRSETQQDGFNLTGWYENHNFYPVIESQNCVLMSYDEDRVLYNYAPEIQKKTVVAI